MTNQANNAKIPGWLGKCHICHEVRPIKWCGICKHWFCDTCRYSPERVAAAMKELIHGSIDGCCGPLENK